jgi:predicted enzyme related to lactoylglutathione lyase
MNTIGYFDIQVTDPKTAIAFYKVVFGWKFIKQKQIPGDLDEYYVIRGAGMMGGMVKRNPPVPPPKSRANAFVCSMEVENFDKTAKKILKYGGRAAVPKTAIPNRCWVGYFLDSEKNIFGIFQVDENAK